MFIQLAVLVVVQALYASAGFHGEFAKRCNLNACAFQKCEDQGCCLDAVKALCDLTQLEFGFDPVQGPKSFNHTVGNVHDDAIDFELLNVFVRGIRTPDAYSNHKCNQNGFSLHIHYPKLEICASTSIGSYSAIIKNINADAELTLKYVDGKAVVDLQLVDGKLPELEEYTLNLTGRDIARESFDGLKVKIFVARLLQNIYITQFEKLFNKYQC